MPDIVANRDFDKFSHKEQVQILRYMYDVINNEYYGSELPNDVDIRICIITKNAYARHIPSEDYTPTIETIRQFESGDIDSLPTRGIEFNELEICKKPYSHHKVWPCFLEDTMAHEMVHLFCKVHGIQDVNAHFKDGKFTVFGYHNKHFKKAAIEHGQTCEKTDGRNGFMSTHLITHFQLESWMTDE